MIYYYFEKKMKTIYIFLSALCLNGTVFADTIIAPPQTIICSADPALPDAQKCTTPDGQQFQHLTIDFGERSIIVAGTYTFISGIGDFYGSAAYYYKNVINQAAPGIFLQTASNAHPAIQSNQAWREEPPESYNYREGEYICQAVVELCSFINPS